MRLEYIKSFISVVNCKSFLGAAKETFLSQPTISTHIKQLEEELGVQLLIRSTKKVILSEAGVIFYPFAVRLLETEREALAQLHKNEETVKGTVTIATSSVPGNYILPQFLSHIKKTYPELTFRIQEADSEDVIQSVIHFGADLGIGSIESRSESCTCYPIAQDRIVLITPATQEYRRMNGNFPKERLQNETYVVREAGSGTRLAAESVERELGLLQKPIRTALWVESSEMVKRSVEQGLGVAFVSSLSIENSVEEKRLLKFEFPEIHTERQIYLMYHKERVLTLPITSTIKLLRSYCQKL